MKGKKLLILLGSVCLALMMVAMVACAAPTPTPSPSPSPSPSPTPSPSPSPTPSPSPPPTAEKVKILFVCGATSLSYTDTADYFKANLEEITGGRMQVEVILGEALAPLAEHLDSMGTGMFDMLNTWDGYFRGKVPFLNFVSLCSQLIEEGMEDANILYEYFGWKELYESEWNKYNCHFISFMNKDPGVGFVSRKPVPDFESLKGLKIRAVGTSADIMTNAGASVVYLPADEVYSALASGMIDAALYGAVSDHYGFGWQDVTKYWVPVLGKAEEHGISCNMDFWNGLSREDQSLIETVAQAAQLYSCNNRYYLCADSVKKARDAGVEFQPWDADNMAKWRGAALPLLDTLPTDDAASQKAKTTLIEFLKFRGLMD